MQIGKYKLDTTQEKIVRDTSKYLLVTAGAGSGKTLTILGKIAYLVNVKNIMPSEILCISFTQAASTSLKNKLKKELNLDIPTYTFHKLSLEILKESKKSYEISDPDLLDLITEEFFEQDILTSTYLLKEICTYFKEGKQNFQKSYQKIKQNKYLQLNQLKHLCITFIRLMKCNDYNLSDFTKFLKRIKSLNYFRYRKEKIVLELILNIYIKYESYLKENQEIDFDDMLIKATNYLKQKEYSPTIKYIIIDEYQDTSYIRFQLIKELLIITDSNLMVVGDDFQSIYKFTGCDVSLFTNFSKYFKEAKIEKLEKTYRNSETLIKIAGKFIMKNKNQMKKNLYSDKVLTEPIKIIKYTNIQEQFLNIIDKLSEYPQNKILVLGRNNKDINKILNDKIKYKEEKIIIEKYQELDITYMTVHKAKGLESDNVIIINLENKVNGFPNQLKEEPLTRLVTKEEDRYPYSEERRLFYVALTRTKNYVYLLVPKKNSSIFIEELEQIIYDVKKEQNFSKLLSKINK